MRDLAKHGLVAAVALLAGACPGTAERPCDPLMAQRQPIALGEILGVGRDAAGTLYVADRPDEASEVRVFVSEGETLVRKRVTGSGEGREQGLDRLMYTVEDEGESFRLLIEVGPEQTRMAVAPASAERTTSIDELGADAELLEVLDEDAVAGMTLQNLPGDVELEYLAQTEEGGLLVVVRPAEDWDYEDFRLFLGPERRIVEREVASVRRQRDGGTTHIEFELAGEQAVAFFPVESVDGEFSAGPATLTIGDRTEPLARLEPSQLPGEAEFLCRE